MKHLILLIASGLIWGSAALSAAAGKQLHATFFGTDDVAKLINQVSATTSIDKPLRTIGGGQSNVGLFVVYRPEEADQGCTIEHDTLANDKTTSIFIVIDGAGTLVTGGKLTKPIPIASNDPDFRLLGSGVRGSGIECGESRRISKGDVVIVPPGVPHGFSAIEKSITYEVVRVDSGKVLPLR
jgi:Cupin